MVVWAGDFERVRECECDLDRVGDVVGVESALWNEEGDGEETVKSFRSVQRCWCWRLWRISMARDSRGDLVVVVVRRVDIALGVRVDIVWVVLNLRGNALESGFVDSVLLGYMYSSGAVAYLLLR